MKFFRLDLLTLLISLFILNSCKNQDTVGVGVSSTVNVGGGLVDTSTVITNTVLEDSVVTLGLAKNALGYLNDPIFGTTEANIATDLNLPNQSSYSLPSGTIIIDSARLVLSFADGFYGDSLTSTFKVNVYQLNELFDKTKTYYNTKQWNYNSSNLLGSWAFTAHTHDSVKVTRIVAGGPDTPIIVQPQVRVPININFVNNYFFNASSTTLASNSTFNNSVKGLYITLDKAKTTGPGGIIMIKPTDTLAVYYRSFSGNVVDTASVMLPISALAVQIKHTYTATIQTELSNTTSSRSTIYLQGLAGLRTKVSFPSFLQNLRSSLLKRDSDLVINRAELVITPLMPTNTVGLNPFNPLPKISMYRLDIAHQHIELQDATIGGTSTPGDPRNVGVAYFGGFYSPSKQNYHFVITSFLQDMLLKKTVDYGTFIAPVDTTNTTTVDYLPTPQVAARTVAGGGANKSSPYSIKLNVIYTKIAK